MLIPTEIKRTSERELKFVWNDGHVVRFTLQFLRDQCPCAGCKGETGLLGVQYLPMQLPVITPGKYELTGLETVGNYAVAMKWKDGHDTGIYTWDYLLELEKSPS